MLLRTDPFLRFVAAHGKQVELVPGADHGWETGDWRTELDVIAHVTGAIKAFADRFRG